MQTVRYYATQGVILNHCEIFRRKIFDAQRTYMTMLPIVFILTVFYFFASCYGVFIHTEDVVIVNERGITK